MNFTDEQLQAVRDAIEAEHAAPGVRRVACLANDPAHWAELPSAPIEGKTELESEVREVITYLEREANDCKDSPELKGHSNRMQRAVDLIRRQAQSLKTAQWAAQSVEQAETIRGLRETVREYDERERLDAELIKALRAQLARIRKALEFYALGELFADTSVARDALSGGDDEQE